MFSSNCCFLTCIHILRRQVRWSGIPTSWRIFQFVVIHTVKGFGIVNKAEVDVFLELSCFFDDPVNGGNLISRSSAISKSSLNILKFMIQVLLKPHLENFEHYFARVWNECNCAVVWAFIGIGMKGCWNDLFQSCGHCWVFQLCWHIECIPLTASSFRIWNSSAGIPLPTLALFVVMLPMAHLNWYPRARISGYRLRSFMVIHYGYSWRSFLYSSYMYSCHLFLISSASVRSILFLSFFVPIFAWNVPLISLIFFKRSLVFPILCFLLFLCIDHLGRLFYLSMLFFGAQDGYSVCIRYVTCVYACVCTPVHEMLLFLQQIYEIPGPTPQSTAELPPCPTVLICPSHQHPTKSVTFQRSI